MADLLKKSSAIIQKAKRGTAHAQRTPSRAVTRQPSARLERVWLGTGGKHGGSAPALAAQPHSKRNTAQAGFAGLC
jgi:hypothetical protein